MNSLIWTCKYCEKRVPMEPHEFPIYCRCGNIGVLEEAVDYDADKDPSIIERAKNITKAAAKAIKNSFKKVTLEVYNKRLFICTHHNHGQPCEFAIMRYIKDRSGNITDSIPSRCRHKRCGCFLKVKAWIKSEDCPMGYWPKIEE